MVYIYTQHLWHYFKFHLFQNSIYIPKKIVDLLLLTYHTTTWFSYHLRRLFHVLLYIYADLVASHLISKIIRYFFLIIRYLVNFS